MRCDAGERGGRNREVIQRKLRAAERRAQPVERLLVGVIALDILKKRRQLFECLRVDDPGTAIAAVCLDAFTGALPQRFDVYGRSGDADDRDVEFPALYERVKRRKDFAVDRKSVV